MTDWEKLQQTLAGEKTLSREQISAAAAGLLDVQEQDEAKKQFLRNLSLRGERVEELVGFVEEFLKVATNPQIEESNFDLPLLDIVGTGGDRLNLFNVSTTALFVAVGAGVVGVKHGNRAISSQSGGADLLEELGVRLDLDPALMGTCLQQAQCGFLFAPVYHPSFAAVGKVRKELAQEGVRTMFNLLGPLLNPARVNQMLVGVVKPELVRVFAEIYKGLGRRRVLVVCGQTKDGQWMDEGSVLGPTRCALLENGQIDEFIIEAGELGLKANSLEELKGGESVENARVTKALLAGEITDGRRDMLLFNAALALRAAGVASTVSDGIELAKQSLDLGKASEALEKFVQWHQENAG